MSEKLFGVILLLDMQMMLCSRLLTIVGEGITKPFSQNSVEKSEFAFGVVGVFDNLDFVDSF